MTAKDDILNRIRSANEQANADSIKVSDIARNLISYDAQELLTLFIKRLEAYGVVVHQDTEDDIGKVIIDRISELKKTDIIIPEGLSINFPESKINFIRDNKCSTEVLDNSDGIVSRCAFGIAETGSIVLDGSEDQGRRAISLVPDWHMCVIRQDQILPNVSTCMAMLKPAAMRGSPITFISGPSATADIEFQRVQGVHGPRNLEVLITTN